MKQNKRARLYITLMVILLITGSGFASPAGTGIYNPSHDRNTGPSCKTAIQQDSPETGKLVKGQQLLIAKIPARGLTRPGRVYFPGGAKRFAPPCKTGTSYRAYGKDYTGMPISLPFSSPITGRSYFLNDLDLVVAFRRFLV